MAQKGPGASKEDNQSPLSINDSQSPLSINDSLSPLSINDYNYKFKSPKFCGLLALFLLRLFKNERFFTIQSVNLTSNWNPIKILLEKIVQFLSQKLFDLNLSQQLIEKLRKCANFMNFNKILAEFIPNSVRILWLIHAFGQIRTFGRELPFSGAYA